LLIDPVALLQVFSRLTREFLYSQQRRLQILSREKMLSYTMRRRHFWWESTLWVDQFPAVTTIILHDRDVLVPSDCVRRYVEASVGAGKAGDAVVHMLEGDHGAFLLDADSHATIISELNGRHGHSCKSPSSSVIPASGLSQCVLEEPLKREVVGTFDLPAGLGASMTASTRIGA